MIDGKRAESRKPSSVLATFRLLVGVLFSFEAIFALYLYSNALKFIFPFPFPVDETLVFAAMAALTGMFIVLRKGIYQPGLLLIVMVLVFIGWVLVTWTWSPSRIIAKSYVKSYFAMNLFSVVAAGLVIAPARERIIRFFLWTSFLATIVAIQGSWLYLNYGSIMFYEDFLYAGRAYLLWSYATAFGSLVLFAITIFSRFLSGKQLVSFLLLLPCMYFILVSGSRGALLGFGLGSVILLLGSGRLWEGRRLQVTTSQIIAALVFFSAVGYVVWMVVEGTATGSIARFVKLFRQVGDDSVVLSANRFSYFGFAIKLWLSAPIFGNGLGSFSISYRNMELSGSYPHNMFLEILAEYGLIGLVLFLMVLVYVCVTVGKSALMRDPVMLTLMAMFVLQFTKAMVSGTVSNQSGMFAMLGLLTAAPALARSKSRWLAGDGSGKLPPSVTQPPFWIRWQA